MNRELLPEYIFGFMPILRRKLFKRHPACDLPNQQMNVLIHISFNDGQPMNHYGHKMSISKPNLTKVVNRLIDGGFVTRGKDKNDRRIITLHMTEEGKAIVANHWNDMKEQIMESTKTLSDDEMQALYDSFETIKEIFEKLDETREEKSL